MLLYVIRPTYILFLLPVTPFWLFEISAKLSKKLIMHDACMICVNDTNHETRAVGICSAYKHALLVRYLTYTAVLFVVVYTVYIRLNHSTCTLQSTEFICSIYMPYTGPVCAAWIYSIYSALGIYE